MSTEDKRREAIKSLVALYKDELFWPHHPRVSGNRGLAKVLGVTEAAIANWIARGHIPHERVKQIFDKRGRAWRAGFRPEDVCKGWEE